MEKLLLKIKSQTIVATRTADYLTAVLLCLLEHGNTLVENQKTQNLVATRIADCLTAVLLCLLEHGNALVENQKHKPSLLLASLTA